MQSGELDRNPGYQLWLASNAWQRIIRKAIGPLGLTHVQFTILVSIGKLPDAGLTATQRHIARFAGIDENMTSQVIRHLIEKGFISRSHHPEDARAYIIELTDEGHQMIARARELIVPMREAFFSPIKGREEELADLLRQIASNECLSRQLSEE
jgi:DNA-binding MarR family transcriptional regulator